MDDRYCPECFNKMGKNGFAPSGRKRVQRWLCFKCLRTTTKPLTVQEALTKAQSIRKES